MGGGLAGDFGGEAVGDIQEVAQLVGGRGKLVGMVVAGAAQVGPRGGGLTREFAVAQVDGEAQQLRVSGAALHARLTQGPVLAQRFLDSVSSEHRHHPRPAVHAAAPPGSCQRVRGCEDLYRCHGGYRRLLSQPKFNGRQATSPDLGRFLVIAACLRRFLLSYLPNRPM